MKLELAERLSGLLNESLKKENDLKAWRFDLHELKGLEIGLKNNQIGGPYSAPSYKRSISGELYLIWDGHKYTSTKLDAKVIDSFDENLVLWKKTAYYDMDGVPLYHPEDIPTVQLLDGYVTEIIDRNFETPFQLMSKGLKRLGDFGMDKISGKVKCYQNHRSLRNSDGLRVEFPQTAVEFFFQVNDSYGESYQEKKWPEEAEIDMKVNKTAEIGALLSKNAEVAISGQVKLIFPPDVFESFAGYFLLSNLYGSLVVNRQSAYSLDSFKEKRQVLRDDLSLEINNLLPFRSFSYRCTSEGVPGGMIRLISKGKLQTPILNLKYAGKSGFNPTPLPLGGRGFFLKPEGSMPTFEELISKTDLGLIVYSVLGLHTQDASSGNFSLTADQCLLVKNGMIAGKVKAAINGNFLNSLAEKTTEFATVQGEDNPACLFLANANT